MGDDQWEGFFEELHLAADRLNRHYDNKALYLEGTARLIQVYMGGSEKEECIEAYNQCQEIDPNHYLSHTAMHRVLTPRWSGSCLLYTSPSPRDQRGSRMPSSA